MGVISERQDMTGEQIFGIVAILIGLYFVICATMARGFVLYKLKAQRAAAVFGEQKTHLIYAGLGVILILVGGVKAVGIF